jgi:hypothetical protein
MKLSQIHRFGSSSEKALGLQRELFNEAEMIVDRTDSDRTDPADDTTAQYSLLDLLAELEHTSLEQEFIDPSQCLSIKGV